MLLHFLDKERKKTVENIKQVDIWNRVLNFSIFCNYIIEIYDFSQNCYLNDRNNKLLALSEIK